MKLRNKKTGDVWEFDSISMKILDTTLEKLKARGWSGSCFANSIAQLNEEWEDYKPAEPLIKDEKIRKAVRAWAEINSIDKVLYAERPNKSLCLLVDIGEDDYNIQFVGWIPTLKDSETYTIAELCGEEEG